MPRDSELYLRDILGAIEQIEAYTKEMSHDAFASNRMCVDAVVRNPEIIGEAAKSIPAELRASQPNPLAQNRRIARHSRTCVFRH